ncbi:HD domain-containing phosphohydrolase [Halomonas cupida]|uniref:HD domain-containing phosphohydrolase n=1 Tax=Halomonas cupida TaxID=44933 RepID=UPI003EF413CF
MRLPFHREQPIQLLIAASIVGMMLVLAGLLLWQSWYQARASLVQSLERTSQQLSTMVEVRTQALLEPARAMLGVLVSEADVDKFHSTSGANMLQLLAAAVGAQEVLGSAYIGSDTGDFLMVRLIERISPTAIPAEVDLTGGIYLTLVLHGDSGAPQGLASRRQEEGYWQVLDGQLREMRRYPVVDYGFDPRTRPWYRDAETDFLPHLSDPYTFFTNGEQGVTLSQRSHSGRAVLGIDMTSEDLGHEIQRFSTEPGSRLAITTPDGLLLAHDIDQGQAPLPGTTLSDLGDTPLVTLRSLNVIERPVRFAHGDQQWWGLALSFDMLGSRLAWLLVATPEAELMASMRESLWHRLLLSLGLVTLMVPMGILLAHRLGRPLRALAQQVRTISDFNLEAYRGVESWVSEVSHLSRALDTLVHRAGKFQQINRILGREQGLDAMLEAILGELLSVTGSHHGMIYLADEVRADRFVATAEAGCADASEPLPEALEIATASGPLAEVREQLEARGYLVQSLRDRADKRLGVLLLARPRRDHNDGRWRNFVAEVSSVAAVAIDMRRLLEAEARLLDAMIQLVAKATDAKSPHTGGHCSRVPQLAEMLIDEVDKATQGPFAAISLSDDQRATFHLAAWLHDCGKLTTPDHIMEKATKLETRYNRIHEVRTRFEVLWRDADVDYWRGLAEGRDATTLAATRLQRRQELSDAFACVARANQGGETMGEALQQRLVEIGSWCWQRHFDDRLGLSKAELAQLVDEPVHPLPAQEQLLADQPRHRLAWQCACPPVHPEDPLNRWGFAMQPPALAEHQGELYNLSVPRGTLNDVERFRMQEHVIQTIIMLESLPWPAHLRRVPEIAGNHHERMDGRGYPRQVKLSEASIEERVMALADVFEALTASDRPYKVGLSLSRALEILADMVSEGHLDAQLFLLLLDSGVWRRYADSFVASRQRDDVDLAAIKARATRPASSHLGC